jgi:hypothetical protein
VTQCEVSLTLIFGRLVISGYFTTDSQVESMANTTSSCLQNSSEGSKREAYLQM